jgi:hypothetical protein
LGGGDGRPRGLLLAAGTARADPIIGGLPGRVGNEVRAEVLGQNVPQTADVNDYGNLARNFMVYGWASRSCSRRRTWTASSATRSA